MITRKTIEERPELENWVHDDCPLILVGNAAHAMPVCLLLQKLDSIILTSI